MAIMSEQSKAHRRRQLMSWTALALGAGISVGLIACLGILGASRVIQSHQKPLLSVSLALEIVSLVAFAALATLLVLQLHERIKVAAARRWMMCGVYILINVLAGIITVAALSLVTSRTSTRQRQSLIPIIIVGYVLCVANLITSAAFLRVSFAPPKLVQEITTATDHGGSISTMSELKDSPNMKNTGSSFVDGQRTFTPTSGFYDSPSRRASVRMSVQKFLQPMDSKARLIRHGSFQSGVTGQSDHRDSMTQNRADSFDTWEVDMEPQTISPPPSAFVTTRLDPIPASRPASPAKPLDGPFPDPAIPEDSPIEISTDDHLPSSFSLQPPPRRSPPRSRSTEHIGRPSLVRVPSNPDQQSHIHPLFRTDSPNPPPVTSPGTIVTASPWGGQVVTSPEEAWTAARSPSLTHYDRENGLKSPSMVSMHSARPGSAASYNRALRPPLRSVRSEEPVMNSPVRANMPPRLDAGSPVM